MALHRYFKPVASCSSPNGPLRADENMKISALKTKIYYNEISRYTVGSLDYSCHVRKEIHVYTGAVHYLSLKSR